MISQDRKLELNYTRGYRDGTHITRGPLSDEYRPPQGKHDIGSIKIEIIREHGN